MDRTCRLPQIGPVDRKAGEFWVENPFDMPRRGHNLSAYERNRLYLNVPGKSFLDASFASRVDLDADSRSAVAADFDRDGRVDLLVASSGGGPLRLFRNRRETPNHYLHLRLVGTTSNRSGIGSRVILRCGERQIVRDYFPANGCLGQGPSEWTIGLGDAERVDELMVRWPSGSEQKWTNVAANRTLSLVEGAADTEDAQANADAGANRAGNAN